MKLEDVSTKKLKRMIRDTERVVGQNSDSAAILRCELQRRRVEGADQRRAEGAPA